MSASENDDDDDVFSDAPEAPDWLIDLAAAAGVPPAVPLELVHLFPELKGEIFDRLRSAADRHALGGVTREFRRLLAEGTRRRWRVVSAAYVAELAAVADWWRPPFPAEPFAHHAELKVLTETLGWVQCLRLNVAGRPRCDPAAFVGELRWDDMHLERQVLRVLEPRAEIFVGNPRVMWTYSMHPSEALPRADRYYTHAAVVCAVLLTQALPGTEFDADLIVQLVDKWVAADGAPFCAMMLLQQLEAVQDNAFFAAPGRFNEKYMSVPTMTALLHLTCRYLLQLPAPFATQAEIDRQNFRSITSNSIRDARPEKLPILQPTARMARQALTLLVAKYDPRLDFGILYNAVAPVVVSGAFLRAWNDRG